MKAYTQVCESQAFARVVSKGAAQMERLTVLRGQRLLTEGEPGNCMYILESGETEAHTRKHGSGPELPGACTF